MLDPLTSAIDFALPLTEDGRVQPLLAEETGEAALVPGLARAPH